MKNQILFRKAKLTDSNKILNYLHKTPELQGNKKETTAYTKDFVIGSIKNPERDYIYVAEENKKIIGFIMAELFKHKRYSTLLEIFTHPDYRRKRIASNLFKDYLVFCKKHKITTINAMTQTSNKKIQKFNKKHGFKKGNKFYFYERRVK